MIIMEVTKKCDTNEVILAKIFLKLEEIERPLRWLALKTEINYNTLFAIMKQNTTKMSADKLEKINAVLGTDFCIEPIKID